MRRPPPWLVVVLAGAVIGVVFAAVSTYDFVQHLDRQVHSLHCSFIPGAGAGHAGESGCQVAMMSPYSSVFRSHVWGGIPIALAAMAVFAFLLFYALDLIVTGRAGDRRATGLLALATALPAVTSVVMLAISLSKLGTTCKLCVCIYVASALCLTGGAMLWRRARAGGGGRGSAGGNRYREDPEFIGTAKPGRESSASRARLIEVDRVAATGTATSNRSLAAMFGVGVAFVGVPVVLYL
ncbi:MAG TPA: vitamin K epoxide reductase family protein, partial [Kofleriaceae bacterium]|nr:vitamin K epoxide reductase family protein [Kofleriaceae bacterium]